MCAAGCLPYTTRYRRVAGRRWLRIVTSPRPERQERGVPVLGGDLLHSGPGGLFPFVSGVPRRRWQDAGEAQDGHGVGVEGFGAGNHKLGTGFSVTHCDLVDKGRTERDPLGQLLFVQPLFEEFSLKPLSKG